MKSNIKKEEEKTQEIRTTNYHDSDHFRCSFFFKGKEMLLNHHN